MIAGAIYQAIAEAPTSVTVSDRFFARASFDPATQAGVNCKIADIDPLGPIRPLQK
jgi:hypothetical protein